MRLDAPDETLDHHDRCVHDQPEVERPEAHEIGRVAEQAHADEGDQHRDRNHRRHDQRGPHVAQEQEEHGDHEETTLHQILHDGAGGAANQLGLIVERRHLHTRGQRLLNLGHPLAYAFNHVARIGTFELEHHPTHDFFSAVLRHGAVPRQSPDHHGADVAHANRCAEKRADLHPQHVVRVFHAAEPTQGVAFAALLEVAAAEREGVPGERVVHVGHGQATRRQLDGIDDHLHPLGESAPRIDFRDAGHRAQARTHRVVVERLELRQR